MFDENGEFRNGQHRLQTILITGIPMKVIVVKNAPAESFLVYDDGRKRSIGDVLFIKGEQESLLPGEGLKHIWFYLSRAQPGQVATKQQLIDLLQQHPSVRDSVALDVALFQRGQLDRPVIVGMHWLFRQADQARADRFIEQYITGLDYDRGDATDASYILRELVSRYHTDKRMPQLTRRQKMALFVSAFIRGNQSAQRLRMPIRTGAVPKIRGVPKELYISFDNNLGALMEEEAV